MHPYLSQPDLVAYCKEKGIVLTAYTPTGMLTFLTRNWPHSDCQVGYATVRGDPVIGEIAAKHNVTPTQVILAWHLSRGVVALPTSHNAEHQKENLEVSSVPMYLTEMSCKHPTRL